MKGKAKKTVTAEWITIDDVSEEKCAAESVEEFTKYDNLAAVLQYRSNKLL